MGDTQHRKLPVILAALMALAVGFAAPAVAALGTVALGPLPPASHSLTAAPPAPSSLAASVETLSLSRGVFAADPDSARPYFGARYYAQKVGRFTTVDPVYTWRENLVDPQRWNRYAYVRNNPLRYVDPDGRVIDTIADVGLIGYDLFDIGRSVYRGEGVNLTQGLALGGDIVGADVPFATGLGPGIRAARAVDKTADAARLVKGGTKGASNADSVRFIVEPNGTVVDTLATPAGRYRQPDGSLTDVLQKSDHGYGHSHTHEVTVHRNPRDPTKGSTKKTGQTHQVTFDEAKSIERGDAKQLPPRGRQ